MPIGPNQPDRRPGPAAKPPTKSKPPIKPKPTVKPRTSDHPASEQPLKHIARRKVDKPLPPPPPSNEDDVYSLPEESNHYAVSEVFPLKREQSVNEQPETDNCLTMTLQHVNKLDTIYGKAQSRKNQPETQTPEDFATRLSPAALSQLLSKQDPVGAKKLLNICTAEQRKDLAKQKKFPRALHAALNRRLLADVLTSFISEKHTGLFFHSEKKKLINSAMGNFRTRHLPENIMNNPIAASHLFKNLLNQHRIFNEASFNRLSQMIISNDTNRIAEALIKELAYSLDQLTPDEKDHFLVSIRVMMHAYRHAEENRPGQLEPHKQPRFLLAAMFAQNVFQLPPPPNLSNANVAETMKRTNEQYLQAGHLMEMLLFPGLHNQ